MRAHRPVAGAALIMLSLLAASPLATAQTTGGRSIFTCVSAAGKTLTSDRLIADCVGREQRVLNADGSLNRIVPPSLTAEERAKAEEREAAAAAVRAAKAEAVRRDRSLLTRYPDDKAHKRAREASLDSVRKLVAASEVRLKVLEEERKPLLADAEFYAGKRLPPKLKTQLDANEVSTEAQRAQIESQKQEIARINQRFDEELLRLKKMWAGTPPGSFEVQAAIAASTPAK
ncbi:hypothetical protein [Rhizobacter sp. Root404]|jgi:hypothetical protein|uniref:hypothetical protein n=1 Tax=Rhizobacter sp. Root404 TaxID=1736528 RepID=UPI0006F79825|nr:hypothetical protein [Rhizobacter sp. Root404]KQW35678.1 hypothetical protein ASC76_22065 [Rhizobacter sp. Root404]